MTNKHEVSGQVHQTVPSPLSSSLKSLEGENDYRPPHFTSEEVADGSAAIRWVTAEGVAGRPSLHDVLDYIERRGEAIVCTCHRCQNFTRQSSGVHTPGNSNWKEAPVHDGVWEALQRLIENAASLGPSSQEDAMVVARWRGQFVAAREAAGNSNRGKGDALGVLRAALAWHNGDKWRSGSIAQADAWRVQGERLEAAIAELTDEGAAS